MIKGIGCDITEVARVQEKMLNARFAARVFTAAEQAHINEKGLQTAAGLWAAKEAVAKALGTGFVGFSVREIEIGHDEHGQPHAILLGGAKERLAQLGGTRISLSISHERNLAMAFAVIE